METPLSDSARLRARLGHPVIDADAHLIESISLLSEYIKRVAGPEVAGRAWQSLGQRHGRRWYSLTAAERRYYNENRPPFWAAPAENTLDRATAMLPGLLYERLPEMGVDFAVVYPTIGFLLPNIVEPELRQAACRAQNEMMAEIFSGFSRRLTPAATIPCHNPTEAVAELEYCIRVLGLKVPMMTTLVRRPIEAIADRAPEVADSAFWIDPLALDSLYDYDPLWQACIDLGVPVCSHSLAQGIGLHRSRSNWLFNQTGNFAAAAHAFAKALFFGGVTHRFPTLKFAFLECGVAWGVSLINDLAERWEKRNGQAVQRFDPARIDYTLLNSLFQRHGGAILGSRTQAPSKLRNPDVAQADDFALTGVNSHRELLQQLVPNFFYGCPPDDPLTAMAFDTRLLPDRRPLNAIFSSDAGHWDLLDMRSVLADAHRLVARRCLDREDFRAFMFGNAVRLFAESNPAFFAGTDIETDVARELADQPDPGVIGGRGRSQDAGAL